MTSRSKGPTARRRAVKGRRLKATENLHKAEARARDGGPGYELQGRCRFPLCGCHALGLFVEVSHQVHKGMGGDPTGERSRPAGLICLCNWRHKDAARWAVDKGTIRWVPLTAAGANGAVAWELRVGSAWIELAHETAIQELGLLSQDQRRLLRGLAEMTD